MKISYEHIKKKNIWIWGNSKVLKRNINRIEKTIKIMGICDSNPNKWGQEIIFNGEKYTCSNPQQINMGDAVVIAVVDNQSVMEISDFLESKKLDYCHIYEVIQGYIEKKEREITVVDSKEIEADEKIVKYIDCLVPVKDCNLKCSYCYVRQNNSFNIAKTFFYSPQYIRHALSKQRIGGSALFTLCGVGETLLCNEVVPIAVELIKEGHYVQIVTNGTISNEIDKLLCYSINHAHIFVKFSFHYLELKRLGLLDRFVENVEKVKKAGCSFTIESMTSDELIPYIDEVKEFAQKRFGAWPHISVAREEGIVDDFRILTQFSKDEYIHIWSQFESQLFEYKVQNVDKPFGKDCYAGILSFELNLETGDIFKCLGHKDVLDNIYEETSRPVFLEKVGFDCKVAYCYNCHAYAALGVIPELDAPTYYELRDRMCESKWINNEMKKIFTQKLCNNVEIF